MTSKVKDKTKQIRKPQADEEQPIAKPERQPRRQLTNGEKASIAMDRFAPLRDGKKPEDIKVLAERYKRDAAVITKAIQSAFGDRLVELVRVPEPREPTPRIKDLESALRATYARLRTAIVIQPPPMPSGQEGETAIRVWDDDVHQGLGEAAARVLSEAPIFREGDVIGLGSGRGVYYVVDALTRLPALRVSDVTVVSLTGALYARDHAKRVNARLDADFHVSLFGLCIEHAAHLRLVSHPLACSTQEQLARARELTCLGEKQWQQKPVSHALVGVGVFSVGHWLYDETTTSRPDPVLVPIYSELKDLVQISRSVQNEAASYYPVADICNHLFYVPPPRNIRVLDESKEQMIRLIAAINSRLLNVRAEQLSKVAHCILVAGTPKKSWAIKQLLAENDSSPSPIPQCRIDFLCTDRRTADELLKEDAA